MSVLRETYGEKTECNFPLETVTKRRKNKGLETSPSRVKESSKGINQDKMPGEGFYLQWNSWGHVRGGKSLIGLRGGAVAHSSAQFCSQLHICILEIAAGGTALQKKKTNHILFTDGFYSLSWC